MRGINHLVLAGRDLGALRAYYASLGFTLTPIGQHPFGTANTVIQLRGCYLELLSVDRPEAVVEPGPGRFSFSAYNRDYLARHEGFSMVVFDAEDAEADVGAWRRAGVQTYDPVRFSRPAVLADGGDVTVAFVLAHASHPAAPWLGHFACQHLRPDYFAQPQYLAHANGARSVEEVWVTGPGALALAAHFGVLVGAAPRSGAAGRVEIQTATGTLILATPACFRATFHCDPPHPGDGPHLAAVTIGCDRLAPLADRGLARVGDRLIVPAASAFGTVLAFRAA